MKIIRPTTIQDSWIDRSSTNVHEAVAPAGKYTNYNSGSTYNQNDIVIDRDNQTSVGNGVYQAAQAVPVSTPPISDDGTYWTYLYSLPMVYTDTETFDTGHVCYDPTNGVNNVFPVYEAVQTVLAGSGNDPATDDGTYWRLASNTAGEFYSSYAGGYANEDFVVDLTGHRIYQSSTGSNTAALTDTNSWIDYSASDLYKLIDGVVGEAGAVSRAKQIVFKFTPTTPINSIGLLRLTGTQVTITQADTGYSETKPLTALASGESDIVYDWWTYFFSETRLIRNVVFLDIPAVADKAITITIDIGEAVDAEIGEIIIGKHEELGVTQYAPEFSIVDYSRKTADNFGNYTITERAYSKKISVRTVVPNYRISPLADLLASIRATPVLWIPTEIDTYDETLIIYGFYKDFKLVIPHANWADMDLQIEGLT